MDMYIIILSVNPVYFFSNDNVQEVLYKRVKTSSLLMLSLSDLFCMLCIQCLFQLTSLELQYVSPKLLRCRDLELAVPGSYEPNQPVIRIHHVQSSLQVITSKQRPRKLSIFGKYWHGHSL